MATKSARCIDNEISEHASRLSQTQKREALDFIKFLESRRKNQKNLKAGHECRPHHVENTLEKDSENISSPSKQPDNIAYPLDLFIDIANNCPDSDLSTNHDHYLYGFPRK